MRTCARARTHTHTHTERGGHLGVLVTHDPAEQDDDDGDRDRDAENHYGVGFLGCLGATVVTGLEFVVFAVRRGRRLAMHTQTTRNKNTQSCVLLCDLWIAVSVQPLLMSEAVVRQASTFRMHPFDLSWQGRIPRTVPAMVRGL